MTKRERVLGNVERCDKTLPVNEMMFHVRRDAALRARFVSDLEGVAREFGLSRAEYEALRDKDPRRLMDLGVHMPAVAWRSGTGMVVWNELAR